MNTLVQDEIKALRQYDDKIYQASKEFFQSLDGDVSMVDFMYIAAFNRSLALLRGFCDLLESSNFVIAASLLRMQLDTCMRIFALGLVANANELASDVLGGKKISEIKDVKQNFMRDGYLCGQLALEYPFVQKIYNETSGFIHLSNKHIFNSLAIDSPEKHTINLKVSDKDEFVPDEAYLDAIETFKKVTDLFLELFHKRKSINKSTAYLN